MAILRYHDMWACTVEVFIGAYMLTPFIGAAAYLILVPQPSQFVRAPFLSDVC